ncbi:GNAT family N-acetyltransferase [Rodentibacter pneumotropicus]|uniref:GNAT family N-acetyltransferase n=1 Tax=Rodentibacter pneumotropicus TaxID=758 RepID=UPI0009849D0E|nr:GNAT family N-acetyltransferase [Rodentibacter pneumotropicus]OOF63392.1 GNAT family N-acetyltransferase [Rodentibacter pneumotropicus]THA18813.1 N-acetyltransferase [Rodentibacter pneumotropicus]
MKIHHQEDYQKGEFFILNEQGEKIAKLTYFYETENKINANHTFVSNQLRGQGIADKLYQALLAFITKNQLALHPTCSYIERKWERSNNKK